MRAGRSFRMYFYGSRFLRAKMGELVWTTEERNYEIEYRVRGRCETKVGIFVGLRSAGSRSSAVFQCREYARKEFKLPKHELGRIEIERVRLITCPRCGRKSYVGWTYCISERFGHLFYCGRCGSHFTRREPNVTQKLTWSDKFTWLPIRSLIHTKNNAKEEKQKGGAWSEGSGY